MSMSIMNGHRVLADRASFDGVKVFSSTLRGSRSDLESRVSGWLAAHAEAVLVDIVVRQSSDFDFHCLSIIVFINEPSQW